MQGKKTQYLSEQLKELSIVTEKTGRRVHSFEYMFINIIIIIV